MHAMGLPLVAEEAGGGRKLHADADLLVASEGLQVRVHILARAKLDKIIGVCL